MAQFVSSLLLEVRVNGTL